MENRPELPDRTEPRQSTRDELGELPPGQYRLCGEVEEPRVVRRVILKGAKNFYLEVVDKREVSG